VLPLWDSKHSSEQSFGLIMTSVLVRGQPIKDPKQRLLSYTADPVTNRALNGIVIRRLTMKLVDKRSKVTAADYAMHLTYSTVEDPSTTLSFDKNVQFSVTAVKGQRKVISKPFDVTHDNVTTRLKVEGLSTGIWCKQNEPLDLEVSVLNDAPKPPAGSVTAGKLLS
jgi:hypothetical protein